MRKPFLLFLCILVSVGLYANSIDSLYNLFNTALLPSHKLAAANGLFSELNKLGEADNYATFTTSQPLEEVELIFLNSLTNHYFDASRFNDCIKASKRGVELARSINDTIKQTDFLSTICACYQRIGNFSKALDYAQQSLSIEEALGDLERQSSTLSNLSAIYLQTERLDMAEECILKAINLERRFDNHDRQLAVRLGMWGNICIKQGKYEDAFAAVNESLDIDRAAGREEKVAIRLSQLSDLYFELKEYEMADSCSQAALQVFEQHNRPTLVAICYRQLGTINQKLNQPKKAEGYLLKALTISQELGIMVQEQKAYYQLYELNKTTHPARALAYFELYSEIKDSIFNANTLEQINEFEVKYTTREKDHQIELQQLTIKQQKQTQIFIVLFVVLLICMLAVAYKQYITQCQRSQELAQMNATKDKFFSIISHDLKNPTIAQQNVLKQLVTYYNQLDSNTIKQQCEELLASANTQANLLLDLLDWARIETGKMEYKPIRFDLTQSITAICKQVQQSAQQKNITINIPKIEAYAIADRMMIETVLRNLVSNAIKFSYPNSCVNIEVNDETDFWNVMVIDQGVGIAPSRFPHIFRIDMQSSTIGTAGEHGTGLGLVVCAEMLRMNNSEIEMISAEGHGSTFGFRITKG